MRIKPAIKGLITGVLMIAVGILMVTNYFTVLASALNGMTPEAIRNRL